MLRPTDRVADTVAEKGRDHLSPVPDRSLACIDATATQQVFDALKRQPKPNMKHTTTRMISGLVLNYPKARRLALRRRGATLHPSSGRVLLTRPPPKPAFRLPVRNAGVCYGLPVCALQAKVE